MPTRIRESSHKLEVVFSYRAFSGAGIAAQAGASAVLNHPLSPADS